MHMMHNDNDGMDRSSIRHNHNVQHQHDRDISHTISNLGDSDRSSQGQEISIAGEGTPSYTRLPTIADHHHYHNHSHSMQGEGKMEEGKEEEGGGERDRRRQIPVATPHSSHVNNPQNNVSLSSRMTGAIPPLPLPADPLPPLQQQLPLPLLPMANNENHANNEHNAARAAMASAAHISPATPMLPPVSIANLSIDNHTIDNNNNTPGSAQSRDRLTLAALYQSSRRSRTNTPGSSRTNTPMPSVAPGAFPPPPPLFAAPSPNNNNAAASASAASSGLRGSSNNNNNNMGMNINAEVGASRDDNVAGTNDPHKISLQSSSTSNTSYLQESWRSSMSSLMNTASYRASMTASLRSSIDSNYNYNARASIEGMRLSAVASAAARAEAAASSQQQHNIRHHHRPTPATTDSGETGIRPNSNYHWQMPRPNLMDYKIEDTSSSSYRRFSSECESNNNDDPDTDNHAAAVPTATVAAPLPDFTGERSQLRSMQRRTTLKLYRMESMEEDELQSQQDHTTEHATTTPTGATHLTAPTLSGDPTDAANRNAPSPANGCVEQLSSLQVRTREEFELRQGSEATVPASNKTESFPLLTRSVNKRDSIGRRSDNATSSSDDDNDDQEETDSKEPPTKKKKIKSHVTSSQTAEDYYLTPMTQKSCISSASFDLIAQPSSRVSSIHDGLSPQLRDLDMSEFLRKPVDVDIEDLHEVNAETDHDMGVQRIIQAQIQQEQEQEQEGMMDSKIHAEEEEEAHEHEDHKMHHDTQEPEQTQTEHKQDTPSERDQRILRRKIQRLLLIRHCSTCPIPIPPPLPPHTVTLKSSDNAPSSHLEGEAICPPAPPAQPRREVVCRVTSHCAEGKALCAHIRTCKRDNCKYKRCLTSREVMGHYKNCRNKSCEICGPVRAMDEKHHKQGHHHGGHRLGRKQRRRSDSSIETIDDEGWLTANMMMVTDNPVSGNLEQVESSSRAAHPGPSRADSWPLNF